MFAAKFAGKCNRCGNAVRAGQMIGRNGAGYAHARCPSLNMKANGGFDEDDASFEAWLREPVEELISNPDRNAPSVAFAGVEHSWDLVHAATERLQEQAAFESKMRRDDRVFKSHAEYAAATFR